MAADRKPTTTHAIPPAYLITFRTYGTWLHGDPRGAIDRFQSDFATPTIEPSDRWSSYEGSRLKHPPVQLDAARRAAVRDAVEATAAWRGWTVLAVNVRTNHVHTVIKATSQAERVLNALKANATRVLRERGLWDSSRTPWVDGGSTRYLWDDHAIRLAVDYVLNRQGPDLP